MTSSKTAADGDGHTSETAVTVDAGSTPLRASTMIPTTAVAAALPVTAVPVPAVPTARILRMLLGVLKHNPTGILHEVGVLFMLYVSSVEVAAKTVGATAADPLSPSTLRSTSGGGGGRVKGRKGSPPPRSSKQREESALVERRPDEVAKVLALALAAEKDKKKIKKGGVAAGAVPAPRDPKKKSTTATRLRHHQSSRQAAKEQLDNLLQAWAAARGGNVGGVRKLLALSTRAGLPAVGSAGWRLVCDGVGRISAERARKVWWSFLGSGLPYP